MSPAPALVLDVVPPPDLPPIRVRRSRGWSVFLVAVCLGLVSVLGLTPSARAVLPALAVPVAKGIGAAAASVLTAEAFEAMWNGDGDKPADDDDSDAAKKGRGKWGDRLKGMLDIVPGVLGALFGIDQAFEDEGAGLDMPDDFKEDLDEIAELGTNYGGHTRLFEVRSVSWVPGTWGGVPLWRIDAVSDCKPVAPQGTAASCEGTNARQAPASSAHYNCFNPVTGGWWVDERQFITNGLNANPCTVSGKGGQDPVESVIVRQPHSNQTNGFDKATKWINPNFDWGIVNGGDVVQESVTAEVTCAGPGGELQTISKTVAGNEVMPVASCPAGSVPQSIGWTANTGNGGSEWLGGVQTKAPASYPECPPGQCTRVITVDGAPCFVGREECYDWMRTEPPSRVKCEYGPYDMPLAECGDLEHVHKSTWGVTPETDPNRERKLVPAKPDGTPDRTRTGTEYRPEDNPNPEYKPPVRGPVVTAPPEAGPSTTPTAPPSSTPPAVPPPVWNPPVNVPDVENPTKNCIAGMASWNPVHWVYVPVKCALTWAFVPKNGGDKMRGIRDKFIDGGFGPWLGIPALMLGDLPQGGGCMGPPLNMPAQLGGNTYYPLNACNDPMAKYAEMSRSVITLVVGFYGMFAIINSLSTSLTGYRMFEREYGRIENQAVGK